MSINPQKLLKFSFQLIDIQIQKYSKLARVGVGPDARISAQLIHDQVNDMLSRLDGLISQGTFSESGLDEFAKNLHFYLDGEYLRGRAGWLLDDNKIHNTVYERVSEQLKELEQICKNEPNASLTNLTPFQKQYLHDSHEVAYRILHLALLLVEDPERVDLGKDNNLGHGLNIMRKHAREGGRYHEKEILSEINKKHKESQDFLHQSNLNKSTKGLNVESAKISQNSHKTRCKALMERFNNKFPANKIKLEDFERYSVASLDKPNQNNISNTLKKVGIFAIGALSLAAAAYTYATSSNGTNHLHK